jgi:hypothetical protein
MVDLLQFLPLRARASAIGRSVLRLLPALLACGAAAVHAQGFQQEPPQEARIDVLVEESPASQTDVLIILPTHESPELIAGQTEIFTEPLPESRYVGMRRALLDDELDSGVLERRRLTAEERSALRLELLRAVRIAYPDDATQ